MGIFTVGNAATATLLEHSDIMFTVALTGGVASGKSCAADFFSKENIAVIDADTIARECVVPGAHAYQMIIEHFGATVLRGNRTIHRAVLRKIIFENKTERLWLEALLHPLIREEIQKQRKAATSPYCVVVIPLLIEMQTPIPFDRICVIDVTEAIQKQRLLHRDNIGATLALSMLNSQATRAQRLQTADDVIDNNGDIRQLEQQVQRLHQRYLRLSK
jgi:dephospho-CoA kinase